MKRSRFAVTFMCSMIAAIGGSYSVSQAAPASLPSVSVSGVTATSPVLRSTSNIAVSATVTSSFDLSSSSSAMNFTNGCNSGNSYCGSGTSTVKSKKVVTTTDVTVSSPSTIVSAADPYSSASLSGSGTAYSGTLTTPTTGTDGTTTVTVSANVSEIVTTCITTATSYWTATNGGGTQVGSTTTVGPMCDSGVTKTGSGSNTGSYVLDINPPTLTLQPVVSQPTVQQGGTKQIHNVLIAGSAKTLYTLTDTVFGPDSYTNSADGSGTFGPGNDGIAPNEHDPVGVNIACNAPVGDYFASAVANTVDLGSNPFDQIFSVDVVGNPGGSAMDTFTVTPGVFLEDQTSVVSELPPSGSYAPMSCFTAAPSGKKISSFPGSLHITAVVNTTGPCAGFATISGVSVTLTLPTDFKFDTTGASPAAHVFIFPAANGFDFHYPGTETSLPKSKITVSGQSVTVDLSGVDLGQGAGVIPSSDTIYIRAHAVFSGISIPADDTPYVFTTSTAANLSGIGPSTSTSSQTVTKDSACIDGN